MENIRVRRLRVLLAETFSGSQTALAKRTGISLSQIGQYFCGYRNIGEKVARKIEQGAGKPPGWLDREGADTPALAEEDQRILKMWQTASTEAKDVACFVLSDPDDPPPPWAREDVRSVIDGLLYAALRWRRGGEKKALSAA